MARSKGFTWNLNRHEAFFVHQLLEAHLKGRKLPQAVNYMLEEIYDSATLYLEADPRWRDPE